VRWFVCSKVVPPEKSRKNSHNYRKNTGENTFGCRLCSI